MSASETVRRVLFGRALTAEEASSERITPVEGLSALSLDALTSVAYGPEAILLVLAGAGEVTRVVSHGGGGQRAARAQGILSRM